MQLFPYFILVFSLLSVHQEIERYGDNRRGHYASSSTSVHNWTTSEVWRKKNTHTFFVCHFFWLFYFCWSDFEKMPLKGADPEKLTFARLCCCCFVVPFVFVVVFNKVIKVNDGKRPACPHRHNNAVAKLLQLQQISRFFFFFSSWSYFDK